MDPDPCDVVPAELKFARVNTSPDRDPSIRQRGAQPCWVTRVYVPAAAWINVRAGATTACIVVPVIGEATCPLPGAPTLAEAATGRNAAGHSAEFVDPKRTGRPSRCIRHLLIRTRRGSAPLVLIVAGVLALAGSASGAWFGSNMRGAPNTNYGCESALILGPIGGVELAPSRQVTCTYRSAGYLNSPRLSFLVPSSGWIKRIQIRSGANPAPLRLTILTGSSRVNAFTGQDLPGTYTCCTARFIGPVIHPRPNGTTTKNVHIRVLSVLNKAIQIRIHSTDGVGLSAVGPGTLPLHVDEAIGQIVEGEPITVGYWPLTRVGEPRVDGYSMTGLDLLFRWEFSRRP